MNKSDLIAAVRSYMNRPTLTDDEISMWIATVEGELNTLLRDHPRNLVRASYTQLAGLQNMPIPPDMLQLVRLATGNTVWHQYPVTAVDLAAAAGNAYIERGTCLELYPAPAEDTLFSLDYHAAIKKLDDIYSENWVSTYFPDVYLYGALKEGAVWVKDDQRSQLWAQEFARRVDALSAQGWNQNTGAAPRVRLR